MSEPEHAGTQRPLPALQVLHTQKSFFVAVDTPATKGEQAGIRSGAERHVEEKFRLNECEHISSLK